MEEKDIKNVEDYIYYNDELEEDYIADKEQFESIKKLFQAYKKLKKYDIRQFKLKDSEISSSHFTKRENELMNLGIKLYLNFDKIYSDKSDEEDNI